MSGGDEKGWMDGWMDGARLFGDTGLLDVSDVHDASALEHLGQADL